MPATKPLIRSSFAVAFAFCFLRGLPAGAAAFHVRGGAAGNGSGSDWTNACPDFIGSCAVASLVRGNTYYVADGSYAAGVKTSFIARGRCAF